MPKLRPATVTAQAGGNIDMASGGLVPPIQLSTTFARDQGYELLNPDNSYIRHHNDTARIAENIIARLEGAADALLYPSGMAAIAAVFRTIPTGGAAIVQSGIYWGTTKWVRNFCARRQITLHEVDASDADLLGEFCSRKKAQVLFVETPSNPWLRIVDIQAACAAARRAGATLVVDSTAATPILSQPHALGADIVMHSSSKAINGHSDVLSGVLSVRKKSALWGQIMSERGDAGAVIGPFEAWLLIRGMRTLPLRIERMCENAMQVAEFLNDHPRINEVLYPGLPGFRHHALARRQMRGGFGFLMSFLVKGDADTALAIAGRLKLFQRATSLGGVESLVEHRQTIEPNTGIPANLLRISVGIEHAGDLIEDLGQALGQ